MNRTSWKCLLIGAVVAVALSSAAPQADAQWWGCYRPAAWGCCYGYVLVLLVLLAVLRHGELRLVLLRQRLVSGISAGTGAVGCCSDLAGGIAGCGCGYGCGCGCGCDYGYSSCCGGDATGSVDVQGTRQPEPDADPGEEARGRAAAGRACPASRPLPRPAATPGSTDPADAAKDQRDLR